MFLLVGLGNPGKQYERTRHNLGRILVERWAVEQGGGFEFH
ncbi:MAG TPA: aminoacyl-tRNA hydrolase, partial [Candidatus Jacksonbacteria bacterium]|nr:aminoacyl-tRNA hydrolase [Candidatus Jacksonbacteria bacterium]